MVTNSWTALSPNLTLGAPEDPPRRRVDARKVFMSLGLYVSVEVRRIGWRLRCRPHHLTMVHNCVIKQQ
ncbi:hypothetical protein TNCV_3962431 [Trichonephila clavipes]|nr:hypothetical protein TNCV_3962431 [Trichonephila clavipes]